MVNGGHGPSYENVETSDKGTLARRSESRLERRSYPSGGTARQERHSCRDDDVALKGGTGRTFDWGIARMAASYGRVILSGGLNPDNVGRAVEEVGPYAVDASSGVESRPGKKDDFKLRAFIEAAKRR